MIVALEIVLLRVLELVEESLLLRQFGLAQVGAKSFHLSVW